MEVIANVSQISLVVSAISARQALMAFLQTDARPAIAIALDQKTMNATLSRVSVIVIPKPMEESVISVKLAIGTSRTASRVTAMDMPLHVIPRPASAINVKISQPDTIAIDASKVSMAILCWEVKLDADHAAAPTPLLQDILMPASAH